MVPKFTVMECLERQAATRAHLSFVAARQLDGDAGGHGLRGAGREHHAFQGPQVHGGVFVGTVGVAGKDGVGVKFLDADFHALGFSVARPGLRGR
jgi:hypothetical protein